MRKVELKLYLEQELADQVAEAVARFRSANRKVSRNEVLENLIEHGFRAWRKEDQVINRVEATIGRLLDQSSRHDRMLRSILLTLADGDKAAYREVLATIEREEAANV